MYEMRVSEKLKRILKRLHRKDGARYEAALNKMREICESHDPSHYKSLRHDLKDFRRAHIDTHFVLLFAIEEKRKTILFLDFQHHDVVYGTRD